MVNERVGILSRVASLALLIGAAACSSSAVTSSIDANGMDSSAGARGDAANVDTVRSETASADTQEGPAMDGGNTTPDVGHADSGVVCGTLQNTSPAIKPTTVASVPTTFAGGPLVDGIYELFAVEETMTTTPLATYQRTFQLGAQGTTFEWIIHDEGVSSPDHHFQGSLSASGGRLAMMDRCFPTSLNYPYDTQGSELTLYFLFAGGGRVFHYRAR